MIAGGWFSPFSQLADGEVFGRLSRASEHRFVIGAGRHRGESVEADLTAGEVVAVLAQQRVELVLGKVKPVPASPRA